MFKPVASRANLIQMEKTILRFWKDKNIFERTATDRSDAPPFVLYEGPPTANGSPGIHHVLARVFKDVICRYKTMKGYRCVRKGGWDTHGLPVELEVEKELGISSKKEIEEYGIDKFNTKCRESVFKYVDDWVDLTDRIAYWVDMDDPYVTLSNDYIETCWWIVKSLWEKGLIYKDIKGTPHCPRCVTSLSSHEVAQGYRENTEDPSVYVKFPISWSDSTVPVYLLAWTTTPWTLPANTGLAVSSQAEYSMVEICDADISYRLILASSLVETVIGESCKVIDTMLGSKLVGIIYDALYNPLEFDVDVYRFHQDKVPGESRLTQMEFTNEFQPRVIGANFVALDEGTGIVHMAPAFGDDDLKAGRENELNFVQPVNLQGFVTGSYDFSGKFVKKADEDIISDLQTRGLLYYSGTYSHTYPFCWRCNSPLLYYAKKSWYINTTSSKHRLISGNSEINWYPSHIKEGRFGEWLRNNVDWAVSRERYWGTPLPIWECTECGDLACVGSVSDLKNKVDPAQTHMIDQLDLHRPYIDEINLICSECTGTMKRVPEVLDAWFDSGAMPYAQWHHPFSNRDLLSEGLLSADYICEAVDQTRGWFYTLHALSTLLMGNPCYKNVICLGLILDGNGQKMSKRLGNVVDPWKVLDAQGADAIRWYLFTASHSGEPRRFSEDLVNDVIRRFILTLWNVYSFFTTYASVDKFHPMQVDKDWCPTVDIDRWVISELNSLVLQVDTHLESYNPTDAGRRIQDFVDRLSNWYVRRSRRRFWKSENDVDKLSAYATLHTCLSTVCKILGPFMPFLAEEMYQNLVRSVDFDASESVHLSTFPQADSSKIDDSLMVATRLAMKISSMGRGARARAGAKVRQPLSKVVIKPKNIEDIEHIMQVKSQILDELNIKDMEIVDESGDQMSIAGNQLYIGALEEAEKSKHNSKATKKTQSEYVEAIVQVDNYSVAFEGGYMVAIDIIVTPSLAEEGLARELVHRIQNIRRASEFDITDRILVYYQGFPQLKQVMTRHGEYIKQETLCDSLVEGIPDFEIYSETQNLNGQEFIIGIKRI